MKWVGTQNICMQTHLTYLQYPEKYYQFVLFVLGYSVRQTKRQRFPVFIRAPCEGGTETSGSVTRYK